MLLDLSSASDTVDHKILPDRLENWGGFSGPDHILKAGALLLSMSERTSDLIPIACGVANSSSTCFPQVRSYMTTTLLTTAYADDSQIYLALSPDDSGPLDSLCQHLEQVNSLMQSGFLQLDGDKREIILFAHKVEGIKVAAEFEVRGLETKTRLEIWKF